MASIINSLFDQEDPIEVFQRAHNRLCELVTNDKQEILDRIAEISKEISFLKKENQMLREDLLKKNDANFLIDLFLLRMDRIETYQEDLRKQTAAKLAQLAVGLENCKVFIKQSLQEKEDE